MLPWYWRLSFPKAVLNEIEKAVRQSELQHRGELRFAIENSLAPGWVWHGMHSRQRAWQVFSNLGVWDTEENSGVLIYILLADHKVDIIADRGICKLVAQSEWDRIAGIMKSEFSQGRYREGSLAGIIEITALLVKHFPADASGANELPNRPVIIKR
jgi:uncharacterized membrane protein